MGMKMQLFKAGRNKLLNEKIARIQMNMENNYKDAAQINFKEFEELLDSFEENGKIKGGQLRYYEEQRALFAGKLKNYTHKDQKPYWT
ncbi:MAG: hypothetical protein ACI4DU_08700 [Lachnospiraceae bacterium]